MIHDVMTIGSATLDLFMKSGQFHLQPTEKGVLLCEEYGSKIDIDEFEMHSGGAGTNTAVGFARMGFKTAAVVEIGSDVLGQIVWDELKRERIDTQFIVSQPDEPTAVSVLLISGEGGRSILTHRGNFRLAARDLPWEALLQTRWIHLSNVAGNKELLLRLFDHLHESLVGLSWNPGRPELAMLARHELKISETLCDIFFVNKEEWEVVRDVQKELLQSVPQVIITDGKNGGEVYLKGEHQLHYDIAQVETKQETGAGDAFVSGYVSAHLLGFEMPECVEWGKREAASVVQFMGAKKGLLYRKDMGL